jgi:hypothetical protein
VNPLSTSKDDLIEQTLRVWQPRLGRRLSREDGRQIVENITGFFGLLAEWSGAEMPSPPNERGKPTAFDDEEGVAALRVTAQRSESTPSQRAGKS